MADDSERDRSKRPRASEHSQAHAEYLENLETLIGEKVPKEVAKRIQEVSRKLSDDIKRFVRAKRRFDKMDEDLKAYAEKRWPPGVPAYKSIPDPMMESHVVVVDGDICSFELNPNFTINEQKQQKALTLFFHQTNVKLDKMALKESIAKLEGDVEFETFWKSCQVSTCTADGTLKRLGLKLPPGLAAPKESLTKAKAAVVYASIARRVETSLEHEEDKKKKQEDWKSKVLETMQTRDPAVQWEKSR